MLYVLQAYCPNQHQDYIDSIVIQYCEGLNHSEDKHVAIEVDRL